MDTSKQELTEEAWPRLLGRLRAGNHRQMFVTTSPEGFKHTYKIFVTDQHKNHSHMIQASSLQNHFLPKDYFDTMYENYSEKQLESWLYGKFVNFNQSNVFDFNRKHNHASINIDKSDKNLVLAQDYNVGGNVTLVALIQNEEVFVFDEITTKNTFESRDAIINEYGGKFLECAGDSSGSNTSSNSEQSNNDIMNEIPNFYFIQGTRNPSIQDSIIAVNAALRNQRLWIDTAKCPQLTQALEQMAFTKEGKYPKYHTHPGPDDFADCLRYMIWAKAPIHRPTLSNNSKYNRSK